MHEMHVRMHLSRLVALDICQWVGLLQIGWNEMHQSGIHDRPTFSLGRAGFGGSSGGLKVNILDQFTRKSDIETTL